MTGLLNHLKKLDWLLIAAVIIVFLFGLLTLYASPEVRTNFYKQAIFGVVSFILILSLSFVDYRIFRDHPQLLIGIYVLGLILLAIVLVAAPQIRGVASWLWFGAIGIQPVEFVKIIILLVLAKYLSSRYIELYKLRHLFVSSLYAIVPAVMVLVQPDLGSAIILMASWVGLVVISGIRLRQFLIILVASIVVFALLWGFVLQDYQKDRVLSFLNPAQDPLGGGYQTRQAIIALGSGGFFGKGLGEGSQTRLGFLPEYQTDFMFSAIGEEWGLFGIFILLGLFAIIFWRLYVIWRNSSNNFARLFVGGVFILLFTHVFINIGTNLGLLPVTGLSLTLVSYGGSNLLSFALALGIVLSIRVRSSASTSIEKQPLSIE